MAEILSVQTRRMVEKVANPRPESFENPLTKIAEIANVFSARNRDALALGDLVLRVNVGIDDDVPSYLAAFFSLIYGPTLRSVVDETRAVNSGIQLEVNARLLTVTPVPELKSDDGDEESASEIDEWASLPVEFRLIDKKGSEIDSEVSFEWEPDSLSRMIFLWYAFSACDQPAALSVDEDNDLEKWLNSVLRRDVDLREHAVERDSDQVADDSLVSEFRDLRKKFAAEVTASGFIQGSISQFATDWTALLDRAKNEWLPDGKRDERIDWLFSADRLELKSGDAILLPSHPFKLRWLAEYLRTSEELLTKALNDELLLNTQNGKLYLDWTSGLSSREQPPIACNAAGKYIFANASEGWAEDLTGLNPQKSESDLGSLDSSSEDEIVSLLRTYLNSHPYKIDGFSVVILIEHGASLGADLFRKLRAGDFKALKASVHMIAPPSLWPEIARSFDELPGESRMFGGAVFPPIQLSFYDSTNGAELDEALKELACDVAILPGILEGNLEIQAMTESSGERLGGSFHPLFHQAVHYSSGAQGKAISISMRPEKPDRAMDAWSTLAVRQERTKSVAPNQPDNYDFVEVKIDFSRTAHLFEILHNTAHWVVTLERHISREQIENLNAKPDILTLKEGIGGSGLLTMIVSSSCGRDFILSRLSRKLQRIVKECGDGNPVDNVTAVLAEKIYEETRHISPVLALQAMGISRVTEEMLGVAIARNVATEKFPVKTESSISTWISMDEHAEWFGGTSSTRPDLCRVTLTPGKEKTELGLLVVEGKLRQNYDAHGVQQVIAALNLFNDVFHFEEEAEPVDTRLWREKLCNAIQNASPKAREVHGVFDDMESSLSSMLEDLTEGRVETKPVQGLFSICIYNSVGSFELSKSSNEPIVIAKSFGNNVIDLIQSNLAEVEKNAPFTNANLLEENSEPCTPSAVSPPPPEVLKPTLETAPEKPADSVQTGDELAAELQVEVQRGKLSHADLRDRFQAILDTYGKFSISVEKPKKIEDCFVEGPASVLYRIKPATGVEPKTIYAKGDSLKLALELEEHHHIRFSISRGNIEIDVPKLNEDRYFVDAADMWKRWQRPETQLEVPLGEDRKGTVVSLNFSTSTAPHLLIGGTTGSGKSEALNTILHGMTRFYSADELKLKLIDPKSTELVPFEDCEHLIGEIESDAESAITLLEEAVDEMQARYGTFKGNKVKSLSQYNKAVAADERLPWWVIVLDEYADLTTEKADKAEIEKLLKRLAQKARAAGIHVIIATQKPSAEVISTNLRSNLPAQLALRVKSSTESRVIMDDSGAETLNGKGDAFLKTVEGLERIQCALVNDQ
ncbi:FtsK/SpoIIIE domain-containing protein [Akkermansiaceae bacterium]|nr:FtsK/SpoIIIE domain-containing protein [Akkermansiaceae bacterium]